MSSAEAVEVVHQMMDARDREMVIPAAEEKRSVWPKVWHAVKVYGTAAFGILTFTLLMAVAQ